MVVKRKIAKPLLCIVCIISNYDLEKQETKSETSATWKLGGNCVRVILGFWGIRDYKKVFYITTGPHVIYKNRWVVGMGTALPYPHPQYPLGTNFSPFTYPWVKYFHQTLTLVGKNPLGMRVMGTHCHR